jgi:hypothetical protein
VEQRLKEAHKNFPVKRKNPEKDNFSANFTEEIEQAGEYRNLTLELKEAGRLLGTPAFFI